MTHGWVDGKFYEEPICPQCGAELYYEEDLFDIYPDETNEEFSVDGWVCMQCKQSFTWGEVEHFENEMFYIVSDFMNCIDD